VPPPAAGPASSGEKHRSQLVLARIAELTSEICGALADHADGNTFRSLFKDEHDR